jgi:hypothetical protein
MHSLNGGYGKRLIGKPVRGHVEGYLDNVHQRLLLLAAFKAALTAACWQMSLLMNGNP